MRVYTPKHNTITVSQSWQVWRSTVTCLNPNPGAWSGLPPKSNRFFYVTYSPKFVENRLSSFCVIVLTHKQTNCENKTFFAKVKENTNHRYQRSSNNWRGIRSNCFMQSKDDQSQLKPKKINFRSFLEWVWIIKYCGDFTIDSANIPLASSKFDCFGICTTHDDEVNVPTK